MNTAEKILSPSVRHKRTALGPNRVVRLSLSLTHMARPIW